MLKKKGRLARAIFGLTGVLCLTGCGSLSIPLGEYSSTSNAEPSTLTDISVTETLPDSLDSSDATVIGQVAARAILDSMSGEEIDWVNAKTGSSGRWREAEAGSDIAEPSSCRAFDTTVTSVKGVHLYSGEACPNGKGGFILRNVKAGGSNQLLNVRS